MKKRQSEDGILSSRARSGELNLDKNLLNKKLKCGATNFPISVANIFPNLHTAFNYKENEKEKKEMAEKGDVHFNETFNSGMKSGKEESHFSTLIRFVAVVLNLSFHISIASLVMLLLNIVSGTCYIASAVILDDLRLLHKFLGISSFALGMYSQLTGYNSGYFRRNFVRIRLYKILTFGVLIVGALHPFDVLLDAIETSLQFN
uniref:Uncharacterized protein n=1 Tax=Glossina pallidipes TaxID=7398 RepID=A0A1A9ZHA3_GLOPL